MNQAPVEAVFALASGLIPPVAGPAPAEVGTLLALERGMTIACGRAGGGLVPLILLFLRDLVVRAGPRPPVVTVEPEGGRERERDLCDE